MSASARVNAAIAACSGIVLAQIPSACQHVASETEAALSSLRFEFNDATVRTEAQLIHLYVLRFYVGVMTDANSHQSSLADNQYAAQSANNWRQQAGTVLGSLVDGLALLPAARTDYISACESLNTHMTSFPGCYKRAGRVEMTNQLTAIIQQDKPDYVKPSKNYNCFWLVIASVVVACLTALQGYGVASLIQPLAILACAICMKKEMAVPSRVLSAVPALMWVWQSGLLRRVRYGGLSYLLGFGPAYGFDDSLIDSLLPFANIAMLALMIIFPLYVCGVIKVDSKNTIAAIPYAIAAMIQVTVIICALLLDAEYGYSYSGAVPLYVKELCRGSAMAATVWAFRTVPMPRKETEKKPLL